MTGRERNLAVLTGVVLGGYVLWSSVAAPAFASWRALGDQLATAEQAVVRDRALGAAMSFLQAERAALDARLRPPPGEPVTPWLLAHLRALGQEAGLDPSALRVVGARELDLPAPDRKSVV